MTAHAHQSQLIADGPRIGIDPGISGAIAVVNDERVLDCRPFPKLDGLYGGQVINHAKLVVLLRNMCRLHGAEVIYIEKPQSLRANHIDLIQTFGKHVGVTESALLELGVRCVPVPPARWKSKAGLLKTKKNPNVKKDDARDRATQLLPSAFPHAHNNTNKAEAILIGFLGPNCERN